MQSSPALSYSSSSSSSSSKRSIHQASMVDPATHSPALMQFIDIKLTRPVIEYVIDCVADTVDYAMGRPSSGGQVARKSTKFTTFVMNVITRAEVTTPTILAALVYIDRAKPHLHIALEEWALERVFLGAMIVASKYCNDSTLKNQHWALCTGVFGKRDVGRIEREFLDVLDFELSITEDDLLSHHDGLSAIVHPKPTYIPAHVRSHAHAQPHHRNVVPDLEPSTSDTSSGPSSPRTPSTLAMSPAPESKAQSATKKSAASFHDIIRSFPIPIPRVSHSQSHSHSSRPRGQSQSGSSGAPRYSSFPAAPAPPQHSHIQLPISVRV